MSTTSTVNIARRAVTWSIVLSILMILAGILAIVIRPRGGIRATNLLVGSLFIFSGAAHLIFGWHRRTLGGFVGELELGFLGIAVGLFLLFDPVAGLGSFVLVVAIYLMGKTIFESILSFRLRPLPGWRWLLVDAIVTLMLAIVIWRTWRSGAPSMVSTLVGISMFFGGASRLAHSLAARRAVAGIA
jgi:uncharacterized membrane protein HdeD (DUF308 family)